MNCANFYTDMMVCIELTKVLKNYVKHCSDYERTFGTYSKPNTNRKSTVLFLVFDIYTILG